VPLRIQVESTPNVGKGRRGSLRRSAGSCLFALSCVAQAHAAPSPPPNPDEPQTRQKTLTSGLGLSAGIGTQYAILGLQAAYYLQLPRSRFRLAPYAGIGAAVCTDEERDSSCILGKAFGLLGSWGNKHRIIADAFVATLGVSWFSLHGEPSHTDTVWGSGLALGYEYMAFDGFFVRSSLGVSYAFGPSFRVHDRVEPALTLVGVGYKLW
jgi:hypothetical protein